tara:strand:- start:10426 stop:11058 length:633 start_codon:yes stop_codon:yes gene_type:complete
MTKTILFDFWGTLVENGVWSPIKQVRNILQIREPFSDYVIKMENAFMTKPHSSLKEGFQEVAAAFNIDAPEDVIDELVGLWNKSWMLAKPYPEVEEILKRLKETHQLVLISNTDCNSILNVLEKFKLEQYFDHRFLSFEVGKIKTDPEFLQQVITELKLNEEDCILVGDSVLSDIKCAEQAGIKSVLIDRRNRRDHDPKISTLRELEKYL